MLKPTTHTLSTQNNMKGKYKAFCILPSISVIRDTQCEDLGYTSWDFYFEWLWFNVCYEIETEFKPKESE